jgi:WxcM-like, C-terminal
LNMLSDPRFGAAVSVFDVQPHVDERGRLYSVEFDSLPFPPQRMFFISPSRAGESRGGHAHEIAHQLLICAMGRIDVAVAFNGTEQTFRMERPGQAIHLAPQVWAMQRYLTCDAMLLVLSSEPYDASSYSTYQPARRT